MAVRQRCRTVAAVGESELRGEAACRQARAAMGRSELRISRRLSTGLAAVGASERLS